MKVYWLRGIVALMAVIAGLILGYSMDVPREEADSLPPSLVARYRFNQWLMNTRDRLLQGYQDMQKRVRRA